MKYYKMNKGVGLDDEVEYIQRDEDKALIPCNEANADYLTYLADTEKVVEDFNYEAEEARQLTVKPEPNPTLEERVKVLEDRLAK